MVFMCHFPAWRSGSTRPGELTFWLSSGLTPPISPPHASLSLGLNPPFSDKLFPPTPPAEPPAGPFTLGPSWISPVLPQSLPASCKALPKFLPPQEASPGGRTQVGVMWLTGGLSWLCHQLHMGTAKCHWPSLGLNLLDQLSVGLHLKFSNWSLNSRFFLWFTLSITDSQLSEDTFALLEIEASGLQPAFCPLVLLGRCYNTRGICKMEQEDTGLTVVIHAHPLQFFIILTEAMLSHVLKCSFSQFRIFA